MVPRSFKFRGFSLEYEAVHEISGPGGGLKMTGSVCSGAGNNWPAEDLGWRCCTRFSTRH